MRFKFLLNNKIRYLLVILTGFFFGIFVFLPFNEFTSYYEYNRHIDSSVWKFVNAQLWKALTLETPVKFYFYLIYGGLMGGIASTLMTLFRKRNKLIDQLRSELDKDLTALIAKGEGDDLEFKSSFRFDYRQQKVNKALESVIIKTIAGFMNARGGSLLIGVADNGSILGLEPDYNSLSRKDNDGFTQLLTSTIADRMGTPACRLVKILFHRPRDKKICRIIVLPSPVPVYAREDNQPRF